MIFFGSQKPREKRETLASFGFGFGGQEPFLQNKKQRSAWSPKGGSGPIPTSAGHLFKTSSKLDAFGLKDIHVPGDWMRLTNDKRRRSSWMSLGTFGSLKMAAAFPRTAGVPGKCQSLQANHTHTYIISIYIYIHKNIYPRYPFSYSQLAWQSCLTWNTNRKAGNPAANFLTSKSLPRSRPMLPYKNWAQPPGKKIKSTGSRSPELASFHANWCKCNVNSLGFHVNNEKQTWSQLKCTTQQQQH